MRVEVDNRTLLLITAVISLLMIPVATFTTGPVRIALGIPFVLFLPGYALVSVLFPRRHDLSGIERIALSFGLSMAVVPLMALILNYTPWGIRLHPILITLALFNIVAAALAYYRQGKLVQEERLSFHLNFPLPHWKAMDRLDRAIFISLAAAVLAALASLTYVIATPKPGEKFTEFYILGPQGMAENYPKEAIVGEPLYLIVGIVNHEHQPAAYRVEIKAGNQTIQEIYTCPLEHEQKWEEMASFALCHVGEKQKVEFYLYMNNATRPYFQDPLHLYIDVVVPQPEVPVEESQGHGSLGSDNITYPE